MEHLTWDYFCKRIDLNDSKMSAFLTKNGITSFEELVDLLKGRGVMPPPKTDMAIFFEQPKKVVKPKPKPKPKSPPREKASDRRRLRSTSVKLGEKARKEAMDLKSATKSNG
jgi:hypothetical protein